MVRAQASAASLSAVLEVLSRFVTAALQPAMRSPAEQQMLRALSSAAEIAWEESSAPVDLPLEQATEATETQLEAPAETQVETPAMETSHVPDGEPSRSADFSSNVEEAPVSQSSGPIEETPRPAESLSDESVPEYARDPVAETVQVMESNIEPSENAPEEREIPVAFDVAALPAEQQELHRRAYRVAKVSMQDIKMLRPEDVRLGRENKDLCSRLRDDIEKAHREYDRRFQTILSHPVDYFYDWMVEVLGGGNPEALGEYPYPSAVLRH
jgi:hypothetical protein